LSIWIYGEGVQDDDEVKAALAYRDCAFCATSLVCPKDDYDYNDVDRGMRRQIVRCCPVCGWWTKEVSEGFGRTSKYMAKYGAAGCLRQLDLKDQSTPIEDIRSYLAANYKSRAGIDPWKFEEVVASVYKSLGYRTRVTARSGDDGIDVVLDGPDNSVIGVQVKRYKDKINVDQIRAFVGALCIEGLTQGIFVTTSSFQSGADRTVRRASLGGFPVKIELVDAQRFYEALGLAQRSAYETLSDPSAPYSSVPLVSLGGGPLYR
jgi:restriction system protein